MAAKMGSYQSLFFLICVISGKLDQIATCTPLPLIIGHIIKIIICGISGKLNQIARRLLLNKMCSFRWGYTIKNQKVKMADRQFQ